MDIEIGRDERGAFVRADGQVSRPSDEQAMRLAAALLSTDAPPQSLVLEPEHTPPSHAKPGPPSSAHHVPPHPVPTASDTLSVGAAGHSAMPIPTPADVAVAIPRPASPSDAEEGAGREAVYSTDGTRTTPFPDSAIEALRVDDDGEVLFVSSSRGWAQRLDLDSTRIIEICSAPEEEWLADSAEVFYLVGGGFGLTISTSDGAVLAVRDGEDMDRFRPRSAPGGVPRGKGGSGRRYPNDALGLRKLLRTEGFDLELDGSGHYEVQRDGISMHISATPSDYRTIINDIKKLERFFGVSLAARP